MTNSTPALPHGTVTVIRWRAFHLFGLSFIVSWNSAARKS